MHPRSWFSSINGTQGGAHLGQATSRWPGQSHWSQVGGGEREDSSQHEEQAGHGGGVNRVSTACLSHGATDKQSATWPCNQVPIMAGYLMH